MQKSIKAVKIVRYRKMDKNRMDRINNRTEQNIIRKYFIKSTMGCLIAKKLFHPDNLWM